MNEDLDGVYDEVDGSNGTVSGDSGACVTTMDGKIHSFVIGTTTGDNKFRLLSPAHFVLEQIKSLTKKKNVDFVRCVEKKDVYSNLQSISRSARDFFSRLINRSVRDDTSDGIDISVTAQTSDSHAIFHTPSHVACTVDRQDGNNGDTATDVIYTSYNDGNDL